MIAGSIVHFLHDFDYLNKHLIPFDTQILTTGSTDNRVASIQKRTCCSSWCVQRTSNHCLLLMIRYNIELALWRGTSPSISLLHPCRTSMNLQFWLSWQSRLNKLIFIRWVQIVMPRRHNRTLLHRTSISSRPSHNRSIQSRLTLHLWSSSSHRTTSTLRIHSLHRGTTNNLSTISHGFLILNTWHQRKITSSVFFISF